MELATPASLNRPVDVLAAALSVLMALFMGMALFSQVSVLLVPLTPVGLYIGIRVLNTTRGTVLAAMAVAVTCAATTPATPKPTSKKPTPRTKRAAG
jgi:hypothetical protein